MADKIEDSGDNRKMVKISELPVYGSPEVKIDVLPEKIGMLREGISVVREMVWPWVVSAQVTGQKVSDTYNIGKAHTQSTIDYIQNDGMLPRLGVIAASGLAGVVFGLKRGRVVKVAFSTSAMVAATAVCFPRKAIELSTTQFEKVKNKVQELRGKSD